MSPAVICPHCGQENRKSLLVTLCARCRQSLEGGESADAEPAAAEGEAPGAAPPLPPPVPLPTPPETAPPRVERPRDEAVGFPPEVADRIATELRTASPELAREADAWLATLTSPTAGRTGAFIRELLRTLQGRARIEPPWLAVPALTGVAIMVLLALVTPSGLEKLPLVVILGGLLGVAGGVVLRAWVAVGSYDLTIDPAPATLGLAQAFSWGLTIRAHRQITVGTARVTLRCREFALSGSGNSRSTHERTVYEEVREVPGRLLLPTEVLELRTTFTVPPTAVPSFERGDNSVRWDLRLSAPVPGWCPDLGEIRPLQVSAQAVSGESLSGDSAIPAAWAEAVSPCDSLAASGGVRATLATPEGVTVKGAAAVPVGETRNLALTVESDRGVECRGVWAWVGCRLHGSGNEAKVALAEEQAIHQGPLPAGRPLRHMLAVSVPPEGPVTFTGEHVKCDWLVRLRFDIPVWPDQHLDVPFLVTPRLTAPSRDTT